MKKIEGVSDRLRYGDVGFILIGVGHVDHAPVEVPRVRLIR